MTLFHQVTLHKRRSYLITSEMLGLERNATVEDMEKLITGVFENMFMSSGGSSCGLLGCEFSSPWPR